MVAYYAFVWKRLRKCAILSLYLSGPYLLLLAPLLTLCSLSAHSKTCVVFTVYSLRVCSFVCSLSPRFLCSFVPSLLGCRFSSERAEFQLNVEGFIQELPLVLREEISLFLHKSMVQKVPIFNGNLWLQYQSSLLHGPSVDLLSIP